LEKGLPPSLARLSRPVFKRPERRHHFEKLNRLGFLPAEKVSLKNPEEISAKVL